MRQRCLLTLIPLMVRQGRIRRGGRVAPYPGRSPALGRTRAMTQDQHEIENKYSVETQHRTACAWRASLASTQFNAKRSTSSRRRTSTPLPSPWPWRGSAFAGAPEGRCRLAPQAAHEARPIRGARALSRAPRWCRSRCACCSSRTPVTRRCSRSRWSALAGTSTCYSTRRHGAGRVLRRPVSADVLEKPEPVSLARVGGRAGRG